MGTINAYRRERQAEYIGVNDVQGNPIHEGDILKGRSGFRHVVIWNPYINGFSMFFIPVYNDMKRNPYMKPVYMEDDYAVGEEIVKFWGLTVNDNMDSHPAAMNTEELF